MAVVIRMSISIKGLVVEQSIHAGGSFLIQDNFIEIKSSGDPHGEHLHIGHKKMSRIISMQLIFRCEIEKRYST